MSRLQNRTGFKFDLAQFNPYFIPLYDAQMNSQFVPISDANQSVNQIKK